MMKPRFLKALSHPNVGAAIVVSAAGFMTQQAFAATAAGSPVGVPGKDSAGKSTQPTKISESRALQEQRRVELRAALRDQKRKNDEAARAASAAPADDAALTERHLNARQRAELRQQLADQSRQQRFEYVNTKP